MENRFGASERMGHIHISNFHCGKELVLANKSLSLQVARFYSTERCSDGHTFWYAFFLYSFLSDFHFSIPFFYINYFTQLDDATVKAFF